MAKPEAIRPISEVSKWIRLMVVAGSGWGKTPFAGTADRCLILSCDPEGTTSAFVQGSTADVWVIRTWDDWEEAYLYMRDGGGCDDYDVVAIDSLNELQNINKDGILVAPGRSAKNDPDVLSQQDYQKNQIYMVRAVKQWCDLPVHLIFNVQWTQVDDESEIGFHYAPMIHGQQGDLREQIKGYMRTIGFGTTVKKKKSDGEVVEVPRMIFTHQPPFLGRDRTNALGTHMDSPTFPKIAEVISAKLAQARKLASGAPRAGRSGPRKTAPAKRAAGRTA